MTEDFNIWTKDCRTKMNKFIIVSFLLATRTVGITVETVNSAYWQPSNRNMRQGHRTQRPETVSVMRPPPHQSGQLSYPRLPVATYSRHPVTQKPSLFPVFSSSQFPGYKENVKAIRSNFAHLHEGYAAQKNLPQHVRQQTAFNQQTEDSTSRKPLKFSDVSDSSISESAANKQLIPFPHTQQSQYQSPVFKERHKQQQIGSSTQNPLTLHQNRLLLNKIPSKNNLNQDREEYFNRLRLEQNLRQHLHTANEQSSQFTASAASPSAENRQLPVHFRNTSTYHSAEPNVQFTQSIEESEHHSTYHAPSNILDSDPQSSAIRITKAPTFGQATRSLSGNQLNSDIKKKVTLNDILVEDCPNAKEMGFCASPPRYPSQQISKLMTRCAEVLSSLYAPVPEDADDEDAWDSTTRFFNSTRSVERGNRHVWSWAHPEDSHQTVCESERRRIEPGYVLESPSGRWYVVLQASSMTQRVTLDKCSNTGTPCTGTKCARGNGYRNKTAKSSRCVQRYSYSHLVTWDPDKPDLCPKIRVFRFPTACVCYLISS